MSRKNLDDLIFEAAQILKAKDTERYAPVVAWMLAKDKRERADAKPKRKQKQVLYSQSGRKIELYKTDVKRMEEE